MTSKGIGALRKTSLSGEAGFANRRFADRFLVMLCRLGVVLGKQHRDTARRVNRRTIFLRIGFHDLRASLEDQPRSEEHTSELQSLMRISYAVFCLKKKKNYYLSATSNYILMISQHH